MNKQKLSIWKSMKLNEDFFDDFSSNDFSEEAVDDFDYIYDYNIQFIIYMYPFIKDIDRNGECVYYFENPKYEHKSTIESGFLSMKKALDYILQATSVVANYSKPKFCSLSKKIIEAFPFMNNKSSDEFPSDELIHMFGNNSYNYFITLETSINLYRRKDAKKLIKMFYSFWNLQQIYDKLIITIYPNIDRTSIQFIDIGAYKNNPYKKSKKLHLAPSNKKSNPFILDIINLLNSKDETDK